MRSNNGAGVIRAVGVMSNPGGTTKQKGHFFANFKILGTHACCAPLFLRLWGLFHQITKGCHNDHFNKYPTYKDCQDGKRAACSF